MIYLAHSEERDQDGNIKIPSQSYSDHINNVYNISKKQLEVLDNNFNIEDNSKKAFNYAVLLAAEYHDFGKLDEQPQQILSGNIKNIKMLNHVDAGVALMIKKYEETKNWLYLFSALLIYGHHIGLPNFKDGERNIIKKVQQKMKLIRKKIFTHDLLRDTKNCKKKYNMEDISVSQHTDSNLDKYLEIHKKEINIQEEEGIEIGENDLLFRDPIFLRMGLSILVHADHSDTSINYGDSEIYKSNKFYWQERYKKLQEYIKSLPKNDNERQKIRDEAFQCCCDFNPEENISLVDLYVGVGKTTSALAVAFKHLMQNENSQGLLWVTPYISLNDQTGNVFRKSITINKPETEVAIIHSIFDYKTKWMRKYSKELNSPISVITGVSFFNILFKNTVSRIKNLHKLAGYTIVIDEYHILCQKKHWKIFLNKVSSLLKYFNIRIVLSSGTPVELWNVEQVSMIKLGSKEYNTDENFLENIQIETVISKEFREKMQKLENERVKYINDKSLTLGELVSKIKNTQGNIFVVMETINKCNAVANELSDDGRAIFMRHSNLTPNDRLKHIEKMNSMIKAGKEVILIATPGGNVGLDLSFNHGFQDNIGIDGLLQTSGRINRHGELKYATLTYFELETDLRGNPSNVLTKKVFNEHTGNITPEACTQLMQREFDLGEEGDYAFVNKLIEYNKSYEDMNYAEVGMSINIIEQPAISILINENVYNRIMNNEHVKQAEIQQNVINLVDYNKNDEEKSLFQALISEEKVSIIEYDIMKKYGQEEYDELRNNKFNGYGELCFWRGEYDPERLGIRKDEIFQKDKSSPKNAEKFKNKTK